MILLLSSDIGGGTDSVHSYSDNILQKVKRLVNEKPADRKQICEELLENDEKSRSGMMESQTRQSISARWVGHLADIEWSSRRDEGVRNRFL